MIIAKTCSTCEHFPNDDHCIGCLWDVGKRENTKWELKKNPIMIELAVLDKIKSDIRHFMFEVNPSSSESDYACNYILDIIDKYKKGGAE